MNERGISKGDLNVDRFSQGCALREAVRFQLPALGALRNVELHGLTLLQALEATRLDCHTRMDRLIYTCSLAVDCALLLSRICSVVKSPPQTLQRQPGVAAWANPGTDC